MNRWVYIILLLLCSSVFAFGQTRNDADLSLSDNTLTVVERNAQMGFNDTIDRLAEDFINVYLVIADPCSNVYSTLGHACLRLQCETFGLDYMFSYESEDAYNKVLTFLSGNLKMGMFIVSPDEYLSYYREQKRGVVQYKLNLPPDAEIKLWQIVDEELVKGSCLEYDYLSRGCAQSVIHFLTKAVKGHQLCYGEWPEKYQMSRREFVSSNLDNYPWADCQFGLIVGTEADKKVPNAKKVVIPVDVPEVLTAAQIDGRNIITEVPEQLVEASSVHKKSWFTPMMCAILLLLVMMGSAFLPNKWSNIVDVGFLAIITILGIFMTYILLISTLPNTHWNWLIIPFNPLVAIFWRWRRYWAMPFAFVILIWIVGMLIYPHQLVNNAYIVLAVIEILLLLKQIILRNKLL